MIGRGELLRVELSGGEIVLQRRASPGGGPQSRRTGRRHTPKPVQALGVERRQPGHAHHAQDPLAQQRPAGQGVVAPAGMAHDRELPDAQRIGHTGHLIGRCAQVPIRLRG